MEKSPDLKVQTSLKEVVELPRKGAKNWQSLSPSIRELCEEAVDKVKQKTMHRRILLKPAFRDYDK